MRKKDVHIAFREEPEFAERAAKAAAAEEIKLADFVRKLFRHGLQRYEAAGSLHALRAQEANLNSAAQMEIERKAGAKLDVPKSPGGSRRAS